MEETLLSLAKLSPVVALLVLIVWTQAKRVDRFEAAAEKREAAMAAACEQRETVMSQRLSVVENRSNAQLADALAASDDIQKITAETHRIFARALDRWTDRTDAGTDRHPIRAG